jgi:predicted ribonuclease YlaK
MVKAEVELQTRALRQLAEDLDERIARAALAPGAVAVLDTNVLLHFQPPDQVSWSEIIGGPRVRLVLRLRVVEELDAKKYSRREDLSGNARGVLRRLGELLGPGGAPVGIRPDATIEVFATRAPRPRPADADEEILQNCVELGQFSGSPAHLVTADTAMRIRAEAEGIAVRTMPEHLERRRRPAGDQVDAAGRGEVADG